MAATLTDGPAHPGPSLDQRYRTGGLLSDDGKIQTYEARCISTGKPSLVRFWRKVDPTSEAAHRLMADLQTLARVDHPNITRVQDAGVWDGAFYVVSERPTTTTLATLLERPQPKERIYRLFRQVATALMAAHDVGVVHRDLRPEHILILGPEDREQALLAHFGPAGGFSERADHTMMGQAFGTTHYLAPEQIDGKGNVGRAADMYGFAAMMHRALTGVDLFPDRLGLSNLMAHLRDAAPTLSAAAPGQEWPPALEAALSRCLSKSPSARPDAKELHRILTGLTPEDDAEITLADVSRQPKAQDWPLWLIASLAVAAAMWIYAASSALLLLMSSADTDAFVRWMLLISAVGAVLFHFAVWAVRRQAD